MSGMVEQVAAALREVEFNMPGAGGLRGKLFVSKAQSLDMARVAIEAMREPTPEMLAVDVPDMPAGGGALDIWHPMIDAALSVS